MKLKFLFILLLGSYLQESGPYIIFSALIVEFVVQYLACHYIFSNKHLASLVRMISS